MKPFILFWISTMVFSVSFARIEYYRIRVLETDSQFDTAVQQKALVLDLGKNLVLKKESASDDYAKKEIESILPMKNPDGTLIKELVVKCKLSVETTANKVTLKSTQNQSNKWTVSTVQRIGNSMERWTLSKKNSSDVTMTCMSFERKGEETEKISLIPSFVQRALSEVSGTLLTSFKPEPETAPAALAPSDSLNSQEPAAQ
jgi:hypothetical protein